MDVPQKPKAASVTSGSEILVEREGAVARLILHNPMRRNAISVGMWNALGRFCADAEADASALRAVIITGSGNVFSAGADISDFAEGRTGSGAGSYDDLVETTLRRLEAIPQVVIAAIPGLCVGAGASLACACDIRVCAREAYFAVPAARLGLGYDPRGIARFIRIFGEPATREALLLAARIPAERAFALGAIHRLEEAGSVGKIATDLAAQAAALAPLTQRAAKAAFRELAQRPAPGSAVLQAYNLADASRDYDEGRAAFAEKRPPNFKGC